MTSNPLRILIGDDDPIIRMDLKQMLNEAGYDVVAEAEDGSQAVELARQLKPDVLILDIKMPEMDGKEFYRICISERPEYKDRFIFSSGDTASRQTHEFLENTHCEVLLKPFSSAQLLAAINRTHIEREVEEE